MTVDLERRDHAPTVDDLVRGFSGATGWREVAALADRLAATRDRRAIRPLLVRLGDGDVQANAPAADAIGRALVALGVMCGSGDLPYRLRPRGDLPDDIVDTIRELAGVIPWGYFGTRRI